MSRPESFESWHEHLTVTLPGARVVFTTRRGGVSSGPYSSLNLGRMTDDRPEAPVLNRARLQEQVGRRLTMVRQVHGAAVCLRDETYPAPDLAQEEWHDLEQADGVATRRSDLAPAVLVADCLPVALAGEGSVAMLHAGWRGLASGVLDQGILMLRPEGVQTELHAAIGPGVGLCCYEVGDEVRQAFAEYGDAVRQGDNVDLRAVARIQLERAGVRVVHDVSLCTSCSPELFFSHRRDQGVTGRQSGVIWRS